MGIGYTTIMYEEGSLLEEIDGLGVCQYDGIETSLGEIQAVGQEAIRERLDTHDLDLYCVMGEWLESEAAADRIADGAEVAADLGAPFLGILPPHRGTTTDEDFERWLGQVCEAAANADVTPVLHHHGATHVERLDEIEKWLARAPDNLGLLWDTAHQYPYGEQYPEGDVTEGIERFADDIEYVHLKDVDPGPHFGDHVEALSNGEFKLDTIFLYYDAFTDLGEGVIDFAGVSEALSEIGYDGHITIEIENQTTKPFVHAKENIDYWNEITALQ